MNQKTISQQKYYEREKFTTEEKEEICYKSDNKCCHCGKPIFVGYGASVDHFIPLNKGGSNQFFNLISLCKDCNNKKDDKLYSIDYVQYLKPKYKKQLEDYLNSYIQVIDYVQRHRLLAYDEYNRYVLIQPPFSNKKKGKDKKGKDKGIKCTYVLKHATWNDLDKMTDYLIKYLKKTDELDSEDAARENIIFWLQFGCIYYIEKNNEVTMMMAMTIKHRAEDEDYRGIFNQPMMYIFPYYQTQLSEYIVLDMIYEIPRIMCEENNLDFIPLNVILLQNEKMQNMLSRVYKTRLMRDSVNGFIVLHVVISRDDDAKDEDYVNVHKDYEEMNENERKTYDFFNKFSDITDKMLLYFEKYADRESVGWMINSIISPELIKDSSLVKYVKFAEPKKGNEEDDN